MAGANDPLVRAEQKGRVAVLIIDNPPVNALSQAVRVALQQQLDRAFRDANTGAIVIAGEKGSFIAGAGPLAASRPVLPERRQCAFELGRQRGDSFQPLAGSRVLEPQPVGVERLSQQ